MTNDILNQSPVILHKVKKSNDKIENAPKPTTAPSAGLWWAGCCDPRLGLMVEEKIKAKSLGSDRVGLGHVAKLIWKWIDKKTEAVAQYEISNWRKWE